MVVFELDGVEIDRCLRCHGTWLDAGEIDLLSKRGSGDALGAAIGRLDGGKKGERPCVRCSAKMNVVQVHMVEIDRCPRGHGLWFDRSEMETLIASDGDGTAKFLRELQPKKGG